MIIYKIINKVNEKVYIGQTIRDIKVRWKNHCYQNSGSILKKAIDKYGKHNFKVKIIAKCNSIEEMNHRETYYIKLFNTLSPNGYNLNTGGNNRIPSKETRNKMSISRSGEKHPMFGKFHSEETKKKISAAHIGKKVAPFSDEHKRKIGYSNRGKLRPKSVEWRNNQRMQMTGRKNSKETKIKRANSRKKKVMCVNTNTMYSSIKEAAKIHNVWAGNLCSLLKGRISYVIDKHTGQKLQFKYCVENS